VPCPLCLSLPRKRLPFRRRSSRFSAANLAVLYANLHLLVAPFPAPSISVSLLFPLPLPPPLPRPSTSKPRLLPASRYTPVPYPRSPHRVPRLPRQNTHLQPYRNSLFANCTTHCLLSITPESPLFLTAWLLCSFVQGRASALPITNHPPPLCSSTQPAPTPLIANDPLLPNLPSSSPWLSASQTTMSSSTAGRCGRR
jgi:hypothetical protein